MQKNRIELAGYLATKPEARFLPSGTKVANARLKESYRFTGSDGNSKRMQIGTAWFSMAKLRTSLSRMTRTTTSL
jgi:single-stranded DNA-binding protein